MALQTGNPQQAPRLQEKSATGGDLAWRIRTAEPQKTGPELLKRLKAILTEADKLPRVDDRTADEIVGYDDSGLST